MRDSKTVTGILGPLGLTEANDHASAIDVADLQRRRFCPAGSGGIERHQHGALKGRSGGINETRHFIPAKNLRQVNKLPRVRRLGNAPVPLEYLDIEEPQRTQPRGYGVRTLLQLAEQHRLVLANVLRAQLIGTAMEVPAEVFDAVDVGANG